MAPRIDPIFEKVRAIYPQEAIATSLGRDIRTIRRWEKGEIPIPKMAIAALNQMLLGTALAVEEARLEKFTFIDLFAGIGGTRLGFESAGGKCVFTSEWDKYACQTYRDNHADGHPIAGDIRKVQAEDIPDHDILVAGFPCQPFSLAGVSKKNSLGRAHGFDDPTQGTLFFDIKRIIAAKRPKAFLLENVKNLRSHDGGKTFKVIMDTLRRLGYVVPVPRIIDAAAFVPQHRERIFIAGFRRTAASTGPTFTYRPRRISAPSCAPSCTVQMRQSRRPTRSRAKVGLMCRTSIHSATTSGATCKLMPRSIAFWGTVLDAACSSPRTSPGLFRRATTRMVARS